MTFAERRFIKRPFKSAVFPGVSGGGRESPKDGPGKDTKSFNIYV